VRRVAAALAVGLLAGACVSSEAAPRTSVSSTPIAPSAASGATGSTGDLPAPDARIPRQASRLADALETTWDADRDAISRWTTSGGSASWPVADDVELLTLYEQRIFRLLAAHPALADAVASRLPRSIAVEARAIAGAGHALYEHVSPVRHVPDFRIRRPEPADRLLSFFRGADDRFGVSWQVLAAVMLVETRMGRVRSSSSAGAQGPMQFLRSTWKVYGLGGDVHDPHDAILGAANYLAQSGAPQDYRGALYHYNPLGAYVTAVRSYAKVMMRDPNAYYVFYNWQVFVRTTHGDVRLSGPGFPV
jgi:soluble lytic murein transglycosylase-like protein